MKKKKYIRNWFSNMVPFTVPLVIDGIVFNTPEHFYQASKALHREDALKVAACSTGRKAKRVGRRIAIYDTWDGDKIKTMEIAQEYRFWKDAVLLEKLLSTKGEIVETNNWHDNFWGNCICDDCRDIPGENNLGKILTKLREEIK